MSKININLNGTTYSVDESTLSEAKSSLQSHLSTVMNGSGATITLDGVDYSIDSTKLSTATNAFVSHLGTIAGEGEKIVVGGVELSVDATKLSNFISDMSNALGELVANSPLDPGLYVDGVMTKSWDELISEDVLKVTNGAVSKSTNSAGLIGDLVISEDITSVGPQAFRACSSLTNITIPDSVTTIGMYAFYNCSSLTSVVIPDSVTSIGDEAFYGCNKITSAVIGDSVASIGSSAFALCTSLESVVIDGNLSIGYQAFYNCTSLTSVVIGDGVTSIGTSAFGGCSSLTNVVIGNSVTSIGQRAFCDCSSLTSIVIPDSVTSIDSSAFSGCSSLESMTLPFIGQRRKTASDTWQQPLGYIFGNSSYEGGVQTVQYYVGNSTSSITNTSYYIPASLKSIIFTGSEILRGAFYNCASLTSITIPNSVTSIGVDAFVGCSNLTIYCEADSKPSGWNVSWNSDNRPVVWGCVGTGITDNGLSWARSKDDTISILKYQGNETELSVPSNINNCPVTYINNSAFEGLTITSVTLPDSIITIGESVFTDCTALAQVVFGNGLKTIGDNAFSGCHSLVRVELPYGLEYLGGAFENCANLEYVSIPDTVKSIGNELFYECPKLDNVQIPDSVTELDSYVFCYCEVAKNLAVGNGITILPGDTFYCCNMLESIEIPDSVSTIESCAIEECNMLKTVTIGSGVTHIKRCAFSYCPELTDLRFRGTIEQWNAINIENEWLWDTPVTTVTCSDGTVTLS